MGKPTGFLEIERRDRGYEKPESRVRNWQEFLKPLPETELRAQIEQQVSFEIGMQRCRDLRAPLRALETQLALVLALMQVAQGGDYVRAPEWLPHPAVGV